MGDDSVLEREEDPKQHRKIEVLGFEEPLGLAMCMEKRVWVRGLEDQYRRRMNMMMMMMMMIWIVVGLVASDDVVIESMIIKINNDEEMVVLLN